MNNRKKNMRL